MSSLDKALLNLASVYRRRVLLALSDPQTAEEVSILDDVYAGETNIENLKTQMYHNHLPRLEDAGLIEWQKEDQQVVKGPKFDEIEPLLELLADNAEELFGEELQLV